jgi:hypothetical protein
MRHFLHNSRQCGKCFRETEEFLSYRVLVVLFQCDRLFGRDSSRTSEAGAYPRGLMELENAKELHPRPIQA